MLRATAEAGAITKQRSRREVAATWVRAQNDEYHLGAWSGPLLVVGAQGAVRGSALPGIGA